MEISDPQVSYYVPKELCYYIREENQKVYVLKEKDGDETFGYDFTLEAGDILYVKEGELGRSRGNRGERALSANHPQ